MVTKSVDILIVGGGLIGAALVIALNNSGLSALLIEAKPFPTSEANNFDARTLALAPASIRILKNLQLWEEIEPFSTPIHTIHISQRASFGMATLQGENEPLGYVVEMQHLQEVFQKKIPKEKLLSPAQFIAYDPVSEEVSLQKNNKVITLKPKLIVAADGINSTVRNFCKQLSISEKIYTHEAITANIGLSRPHHYCAYERFTPQGPLALLPMTQSRVALIWSLPPNEAQKTMQMNDMEFLQKVQKYIGYRLGRLVKAGQRTLFPLRQVIMPKTISWPFVFIGNAAHTLHPVAGQGFNLGLRDVATLVQCIAQEGLNSTMLDTYQKLRSHDQKTITWFTDNLIHLFAKDAPGFHALRGAGLVAMDNMPALKKMIGYYARGFAGVIPDLVCGIPIQFKDSDGNL